MDQHRNIKKALERRLFMSAVTRIVLAVFDDIELDYDDWEYLVDMLVELHERLNNKKPEPDEAPAT